MAEVDREQQPHSPHGRRIMALGSLSNAGSKTATESATSRRGMSLKLPRVSRKTENNTAKHLLNAPKRSGAKRPQAPADPEARKPGVGKRVLQTGDTLRQPRRSARTSQRTAAGRLANSSATVRDSPLGPARPAKRRRVSGKHGRCTSPSDSSNTALSAVESASWSDSDESDDSNTASTENGSSSELYALQRHASYLAAAGRQTQARRVPQNSDQSGASVRKAQKTSPGCGPSGSHRNFADTNPKPSVPPLRIFCRPFVLPAPANLLQSSRQPSPSAPTETSGDEPTPDMTPATPFAGAGSSGDGCQPGLPAPMDVLQPPPAESVPLTLPHPPEQATAREDTPAGPQLSPAESTESGGDAIPDRASATPFAGADRSGDVCLPDLPATLPPAEQEPAREKTPAGPQLILTAPTEACGDGAIPSRRPATPFTGAGSSADVCQPDLPAPMADLLQSADGTITKMLPPLEQGPAAKETPAALYASEPTLEEPSGGLYPLQEAATQSCKQRDIESVAASEMESEETSAAATGIDFVALMPLNDPAEPAREELEPAVLPLEEEDSPPLHLHLDEDDDNSDDADWSTEFAAVSRLDQDAVQDAGAVRSSRQRRASECIQPSSVARPFPATHSKSCDAQLGTDKLDVNQSSMATSTSEYFPATKLDDGFSQAAADANDVNLQRHAMVEIFAGNEVIGDGLAASEFDEASLIVSDGLRGVDIGQLDFAGSAMVTAGIGPAKFDQGPSSELSAVDLLEQALRARAANAKPLLPDCAPGTAVYDAPRSDYLNRRIENSESRRPDVVLRMFNESNVDLIQQPDMLLPRNPERINEQDVGRPFRPPRGRPRNRDLLNRNSAVDGQHRPAVNSDERGFALRVLQCTPFKSTELLRERFEKFGQITEIVIGEKSNAVCANVHFVKRLDALLAKKALNGERVDHQNIWRVEVSRSVTNQPPVLKQPRRKPQAEPEIPASIGPGNVPADTSGFRTTSTGGFGSGVFLGQLPVSVFDNGVANAVSTTSLEARGMANYGGFAVLGNNYGPPSAGTDPFAFDDFDVTHALQAAMLQKSTPTTTKIANVAGFQ